jgi:succinylglutamate desuccinylase
MLIYTKKPINGNLVKKLSIITGMHGNEAFLFKHLKKQIDTIKINENIKIKLILANELAKKNNQRYVNVDLNRSFNKNNPKYESEIIEQLRKEVPADLILDLHTHSNKESFSIITKNNFKSLNLFIDELNLNHCIIISETVTNNSSLIENFPNSISIECGQHNSPEAIEVAKDIVDKAIKYVISEIKLPSKNNTSYLIAEKFVFNHTEKEIKIYQEIKSFTRIKANQEIAKCFSLKEDFVPALITYNSQPNKKMFLKCKPFRKEKKNE